MLAFEPLFPEAAAAQMPGEITAARRIKIAQALIVSIIAHFLMKYQFYGIC